MAKRAGKAASRRARQRPPRRPNIPQTPAPASAPAATSAAADTAAPAEPRRAPPPQLFQPAGSSLSQRERAEYHYVERDLRNIGILTAVLAALLFVAWFAFTSLGIIG